MMNGSVHPTNITLGEAPSSKQIGTPSRTETSNIKTTNQIYTLVLYRLSIRSYDY